MEYVLIVSARIERGELYHYGDTVDLSHYSDDQIKRLLLEGQYAVLESNNDEVENG